MTSPEMLSAFKQRRLEIDCVDMALVQNVDALPISYKGKGYIRQTSDDSLRFKIYATEMCNTDRFRGFIAKLDDAGKSGLVSDNDLYSLSVISSDGTKWTAERVLPFVQWSPQSTNPIITGSILLLLTEWPTSDAAHSLHLHFFDNAAVPVMPSSNKFEFSTVNCDFVVEKLADEFIVKASSTEILPEHFHIRIQEALRFLLGKSVTWRAMIRQDGIQQRFKLASSMPKSLGGHLDPPIFQGVGAAYLKDSWQLFSQFLQYIIDNTPSTLWNRCSYHLYNACDVSAGSVDARAIGLCVSVEGIANLIKHEIPTDEKKRRKRLMKSAVAHISSQPCFSDLVDRVRGLLGMIQKTRPQDRLASLIENGYIDLAYVDAWKKLRNKQVHPDNVNYEDRASINNHHQTMLDLINKTTVLMYQIIFCIIGYKGKFTDYGPQYPIRDYPLTHTGDLP